MKPDELIVVCTRNRAKECLFLCRYIDKYLPDSPPILVVDSSDDAEPLRELELQGGGRFRVLKSPPGLPHQRNVAIKFAQQVSGGNFIIHFIDDDVLPSSTYFVEATRLLKQQDVPSWLGSRDLLLGLPSRLSRILMYLRLKPKAGKVSAAGLCTPPQAGSQDNDWTPGHSFSLKQTSKKEIFLFEENIEFFGEDLEASLRFSTINGPISCPERMTVLHVQGNRAGTASQYEEEELKLRFVLSNLLPERVHGSNVRFQLAIEICLLTGLLFLTPWKLSVVRSRLLMRARLFTLTGASHNRSRFSNKTPTPWPQQSKKTVQSE